MKHGISNGDSKRVKRRRFKLTYKATKMPTFMPPRSRELPINTVSLRTDRTLSVNRCRPYICWVSRFAAVSVHCIFVINDWIACNERILAHTYPVHGVVINMVRFAWICDMSSFAHCWVHICAWNASAVLLKGCQIGNPFINAKP